MSFFTSSEQRERSRQFDTFVCSGLAVLDDKAIGEKLEEMDVPGTRSIIESAILPNFRHGKIKLPIRELLKDSVVVVPFEEEASNSIVKTAFSSRLNRTSGDQREYMLKESMYSKRYDSHFALHPHEEESAVTGQDPSDSDANVVEADQNLTLMQASMARIFTPESYSFTDGTYLRSRSWLFVKDWLLTDPRQYYRAGGVAVHEAVHLQDHKEEPALMGMSKDYKACSELRAYHASAVVAEHFGFKEKHAQIIEEKRIEELGKGHNYVPTPALRSWLQDNRYA